MKINTVINSEHTYSLKQTKKPVQVEPVQAELVSSKSEFVKSDPSTIALLDSLEGTPKGVIYDKPDFITHQAMKEYSAIANQERREEISSLIGVSLYA